MLETNLFVLEPDLEVVTAALARMEALHLEDVVPEGWTPSPEWTELANRYGSLTLRLNEMLDALDFEAYRRDRNRIAICIPTKDWRDIESRLDRFEARGSVLAAAVQRSRAGSGAAEAGRVAGPAPASSRCSRSKTCADSSIRP